LNLPRACVLVAAMTEPAAQLAPRPVAGVLWMLAAGLSFVAMTGIVRHLGTELPAAQTAFLRFAWGIVILAPSMLALARGGLPPGTLRLFLWRGVVHTGAVLLWFYAMARLPLAEVTAIGYLNPVAVTLGAALIFGERLTGLRIAAVLAALAGAMLVLRPGFREVSEAHLAQLGAAMFFAASYLYAKRLTALANAGTIVAMMSLTVAVGLLPLAVAVWVPVNAAQLGWLLLTAVFATLGHYCMTRAFALAPLSVTQPVAFLQLLWATLLGSLVFGEQIDPFVILGGAVIIGAISLLTWRESVMQRRTILAGAETSGA
jgi:drug/metabolite transporter (DMT)-like permease